MMHQPRDQRKNTDRMSHGGGLDIFVNFRHKFFIQCVLMFSLLLFTLFVILLGAKSTNVAIISCEATFHSLNSA